MVLAKYTVSGLHDDPATGGGSAGGGAGGGMTLVVSVVTSASWKLDFMLTT